MDIIKYSDEDRIDDFYWFLGQYNDLYKKYGHKFFVIQRKKFLGIYNDRLSAIKTTLDKYPLGTFSVQECNGSKSGFTIYT